MFILIFFIIMISFIVLMSLWMSGWWILLWIAIGIIAAYLVTAILIVLLIYITYPLSISSKFKNAFYRSAANAALSLTCNVHVKVINKEKIPKDGPLVIYANHKSYADPLILIQAISRPSGFTPKSTLFRLPVIRRILESLGCMPVYRDDTRKTAIALVEAIKRVEDGHVMFVFPEGGRKNREQDKVIQTRAGAFKLAYKSKATILPMTINGNSLIAKRAPFLPTRVKVVVHDPIDYETYKDLNTSEIADIVQQKINLGIIK